MKPGQDLYSSPNVYSAHHIPGPLDYVEVTAQDNLLRQFETDNSTHVQCFDVTIIDDSEFERIEDFSFSLTLLGSMFQSVVVDPSVSRVTIVDNDGMSCRQATSLYMYVLSAVVFSFQRVAPYYRHHRSNVMVKLTVD